MRFIKSRFFRRLTTSLRKQPPHFRNPLRTSRIPGEDDFMEQLRESLRKIGRAASRGELETVLRECLPELNSLWFGEFGEQPPGELPLTSQGEGASVAADFEGDIDETRAGTLLERAGARWEELRTANAYREFFKQSVDLLCVAGADGYFKLLNPAWEDVLGYSREELCSRPFVEFVHPDDRVDTEKESKGLSNDEPRGWEIFENRYRHRDGSYRWLAWRARAQPGAGLIYAIARDVTPEKQMAAELRQRNEDLETFAYVASHDLRAPLRAVDNLSQWIEEDTGDSLTGDSLRHFQLLRQRVKRMEELLEALLRYSRAGRKSKQEWVDVGALLSDVVEMLGRPNVVVKGPLPRVKAPPAGLRQVLLNLISNAIKHGGSNVTVEVGVESRGSEWEFWFADDGPGIAPEFRERVFQPFTTLQPRDEVEGAGIGLALVRRQVRQCGGRVWVEERPKEGSVFRFTWPKADAQ